MLVLGIDAAWTENQPSGISLLYSKDGKHCRILQLGDSYVNFLKRRENLTEKPMGSILDINILLKSLNTQGYYIDCVAVDMPLANERITQRRSCENEISKAYGSRGAATHSPGIDRPGNISFELIQSLKTQGYNLATKDNKIFTKAVIEVYPHTAIIEYLNLDYRYEYKVNKKNKYKSWQGLSKEERNKKLVSNLNHLIENLGKRILNIQEHLPLLEWNKKYVGWYLKGYEDMIDSLISSLVGIDYLSDNITGYGGEDGTIWVPQSNISLPYKTSWTNRKEI